MSGIRVGACMVSKEYNVPKKVVGGGKSAEGSNDVDRGERPARALGTAEKSYETLRFAEMKF